MNNQKYADFTHIRRASQIEESHTFASEFLVDKQASS